MDTVRAIVLVMRQGVLWGRLPYDPYLVVYRLPQASAHRVVITMPLHAHEAGVTTDVTCKRHIEKHAKRHRHIYKLPIYTHRIPHPSLAKFAANVTTVVCHTRAIAKWSIRDVGRTSDNLSWDMEPLGNIMRHIHFLHQQCHLKMHHPIVCRHSYALSCPATVDHAVGLCFV